MKCPLCVAPLHPERRDDVVLDVCIACHSAWFERDELGAVAGAGSELERALRLAAKVRDQCRWCGADAFGIAEHCGRPVRVRCPRCEAMLSWVPGQPPGIDACFDCGGLLLDADAMRHISEIRAPAPRVPRGIEMGEDLFDVHARIERASAGFRRWRF